MVLASDGAEVLESPLSPDGKEPVLDELPVAVPLSPVGRPQNGPAAVADDDVELAIVLRAEEDESWLIPSPNDHERKPHKMDKRAERFERTLLDARSQPVPRAGGCLHYQVPII